MALINCPDCGTEVSDAAAACPKCARPIAAAPRVRPSSSTQTKGVSAGFAALVFLALGGWIYYQATTPDQSPPANASQVSSDSVPDTTSSNTPEASAPTDQEQPAFVTTPADLYRAYSTNEVATDQSLAGKIVQFTAPVKAINKDFADKAVLTFATGEEFTDLQATLKNGDKAASAQLSPGQVVTVRCASFQRIVDYPMGSDCTFTVGAPSDTASTQQPPAQSVPQPNTPSATEVPPAVTTAAVGDSAPVTASSTAQAAPAASSDPPESQALSVATTPAADASVSPVLQAVIAKTAGPSFDCTKATSATALTICSNTDLSGLDRQMAILYYSRTNYATDQAVRDGQRAWLQERDQCGADLICLRKEYAARIQQLQQ